MNLRINKLIIYIILMFDTHFRAIEIKFALKILDDI
jgi:hypothetical protein